jgi:hypothetical protein
MWLCGGKFVSGWVGRLVDWVLRGDFSATKTDSRSKTEVRRGAGRLKTFAGLRDASKRDSSTARRGSFAGANEEEKAAPLRSE